MALQGELGSGKTTSVKAIADALGYPDPVTSPTFVVMKNYRLDQAKQGIIEIVHVDAYRLHGTTDAELIGLSEYFQRDDVLVLIEWPENILDILPKKTKYINFIYLDDDMRKITKSNWQDK